MVHYAHYNGASVFGPVRLIGTAPDSCLGSGLRPHRQ